MKSKKKFNKFHILLFVGIVISILVGVIYAKNLTLKKILKEKPSDIVVVNISTVEAEIYWKAELDITHKIYFKKTSDTGIFREIPIMRTYEDTLKKEIVNIVHISDLEPNTEYLFRIESENRMWDNNYSFKTKDIADELYIPDIVSGEASDRAFVLIDIEGDKYMLNTQFHGTWVIDAQYKKYTVYTYANYISTRELQTRLYDAIVSPVYAESGANCKTNVKINDNGRPPSKAKTVDILNRWVAGCKLGGYPETCYEDVYCRALKIGVDPAFAIAIWSNESGGSNYAYSSNVQDFGINYPGVVPARNFDKQANWFLSNNARNAESYISGCTAGTKLESWGAKFWRGSCAAQYIPDGRKYISQISEVYSWYTNVALSWPFTISPASSACNYSNAYTNTAYNSCDKKGTQNPPSTPTTPPPSGGDGIKDYLIVTGSGITPKDRNCKDPDGCICLYGYTNSKAESTLNINNGYTCTVDKKVIKTPTTPTPVTPEEKGCCLYNEALEYTEKSKCNGTVLLGITQSSCTAVTEKVNLKKGVNFLEAQKIVNYKEVPIQSARSLMAYTGADILAVGMFRNDRWEKILKRDGNSINGQDFNLEPGEIYMIVSNRDLELVYKMIRMPNTVDISKLVGWNLIPSSMFKNISTNSKSILQNTQYSYIKQIALWNSQKSVFDYTIRDISGEVYGESLQITNQKGFFVKIPK
jgi:hypothetical protein